MGSVWSMALPEESVTTIEGFCGAVVITLGAVAGGAVVVTVVITASVVCSTAGVEASLTVVPHEVISATDAAAAVSFVINDDL